MEKELLFMKMEALSKNHIIKMANKLKKLLKIMKIEVKIMKNLKKIVNKKETFYHFWIGKIESEIHFKIDDQDK